MEKIPIRIDRLALEGDGVGRIDAEGPLKGQVAFVAYSLPGETVSAEILFQKKNHSRWIPAAVKTPSPSRVVPRCPYHFRPGQKGPWCGGCDWQQVHIDTQRAEKRTLVVETLQRLGGIASPPVSATLHADQAWRYRNKVQVPFGVQEGKLVAGFYSPGSHHIVNFEDCVIQPEASVLVVKTVRQLAVELQLLPYEEDRQRGWLRHLLVRSNEAGQILVALVTTDQRFEAKAEFMKRLRAACPQIIGIYQNIQRGRTNVVLGREWIRLWGADSLEEHVAGLILHYSPSSFFQVNTRAAEVLYAEAVKQLAPTSSEVLFDLYCGVGAMTLLGARTAKLAVGVEVAGSSIRDARENAKANQLSNVRFIEAPVEAVMTRRFSEIDVFAKGESTVVILDPPRTGCEPGVLEGLLRLRPARIAYVSCNPATLARDLKAISSAYTLVLVTPVDLFPQTSHIESIALLQRK